MYMILLNSVMGDFYIFLALFLYFVPYLLFFILLIALIRYFWKKSSK